MLSRFLDLFSFQSSHKPHQITAAKRLMAAFEMKEQALTWKGGMPEKRTDRLMKLARIGCAEALAPARNGLFSFYEKNRWMNFKGVCLNCLTNTQLSQGWLLPLSQNFVNDELNRSLNKLQEYCVNIWSDDRFSGKKPEKRWFSENQRFLYFIRNAHVS